MLAITDICPREMESEVWAKGCGNIEKGVIYWSREIFKKETTEDLAFSTSFVCLFEKRNW